MGRPKKNTKHAGGRPTVITSETLAKLEQAFSIGASDRQACKYANIDPATLYRYQEKNPSFCERKEMLKENPILKAKFSVYKGLDDPKIALDYLKLRDDDFSSKVKQELTGGLNVQKIFVTPEMQKQAEEETKKLLNDD